VPVDIEPLPFTTLGLDVRLLEGVRDLWSMLKLGWRFRRLGKLGAEAMMQALEVHRSGELRGVAMAEHLPALVALAERKQLKALHEALRQRYPSPA
jgi:hypothetical protein